MRYMIFVIDSDVASATGDEIEQIDEFNESLRNAGHWVMAAGISSPKKATLIDNGDQLAEVAGSLFPGPDFYSGFWIIDAANDATALDLAHRGSRACNRRVELRPFL